MLDLCTLSSGLQIIGEARHAIPTISICVQLPSGIVFDNHGKLGCSQLLAELYNRGTASISSKEFRAKFERKGMQFSCGGSMDRTVLRLDALVEHVHDGLNLIGQILKEPALHNLETLKEAKLMLINEIRAREDDPASVAAHRMSSDFFCEPFSRPGEGRAEDIQSISESDLEKEHHLSLSGKSSIVSWCGAVNPKIMNDAIEREFSMLHSGVRPVPMCKLRDPSNESKMQDQERQEYSSSGTQHITRHTQHKHIILAFKSASMQDRGYFAAKIASLILGGGMNSRLFTEVREKRGLVYDVSCAHASTKDAGWFSVGLSCSPEHAQEALTITKRVLNDFMPTPHEVERAKRHIKLALAAGDESSAARCETLASEWSYRGRIRSELEILQSVSEVDLLELQALWNGYPVLANLREVSVGGNA